MDLDEQRAQAAHRVARPGRGVAEALVALGTAPGDVQHVVQTHLHWDHAGGTALFPNARFHMQAREIAYCTGPAMRHAALRGGYEASDIAAVVALVHAGRMQLYDGAVQLHPGLRLSHVGGHTDGLQVLDVDTRRGRLCLAGDAVVFRANLEQRKPFPALFHVGEFRTPENDSYGALTDLEMTLVLADKLNPGGEILFYKGSFAYDKAEAVAKVLVESHAFEDAGEFKSIRIYRKRAG